MGYEDKPRPGTTGMAPEDIENWLASKSDGIDTVKRSNVTVDTGVVFLDDDSDEDIVTNTPFPNIKLVNIFLLNPGAIGRLVSSMRVWLKLDVQSEAKEHSDDGEEKTGDVSKIAMGRSEDDVEPVTSTHPDQPAVVSGTDSLSSYESDPSQHTESASEPAREHNGIGRRLGDMMDIWLNPQFPSALADLLIPVRPGHSRLYWYCTSGTELQPMNQQTPAQIIQGNIGQNVSSIAQDANQGTNALQTGASDVVVNIAAPAKYFEICVNIGNFAIDHHEVDISEVATDSELFELIWEEYNTSRGRGLRRLFLRPRNIHFVEFSISRSKTYGAAIHKKPDEFPPPEELENKRYHYLSPGIRMPTNLFLHYLHRARSSNWGEHAEDIWLKRLPKKLDEKLLDTLQNQGTINGSGTMDDASLAFGWGVHIVDGPNYAALALMLAVGVVVAFIVSGLVVGLAKTQEQGFGIGSFLLAIIACVMAAVYFQLQDQ
ncbi:hypothetical protein NX059_011905 [Plenodomus lindquistii]|nr:hypothetical protein NX059_011905 [Plenodomus lindquistii]